MYDDMRHFVVFRLPQALWESGPLNSSTINDWIEENTIEGRASVRFAESDFRHHYLIACFSTQADALALRNHLKSFPFVEVVFDPIPTP